MKKGRKCLWLQVRDGSSREQSGEGGARAVRDGRAPSGLHRNLREACPLLPLAPRGDLALVLFQLSHPMQQKTISSVVKDGDRVSCERASQVNIPRKHSIFSYLL